MVLRRASHAGSWYRGSKKGLIEALDRYFTDDNFGPKEILVLSNKDERTIIGGVSPHAGMDYSGPCAAFTYLNLFKEKIPDTVIILGTDHIGYRKIALMEKGEWETPLGNLSIDEELSNKIIANSSIIESDNSLFVGFQAEQEHNIEIQLPFIKYCSFNKEVKIVPIKVAGTRDLKTLKEIAKDITNAINSLDKDIVIIASSDMSHKQVDSSNQLDKFKEIDMAVIEEFKNLNATKTLENALKTSVCGPQTITTLMLISENLGATRGKLLKYYASSEKAGSIGGYCVGYFSGVMIK
ncbi:MAG: AmmeMemoRadiSam system protein B [Candidatus Lokiarchaeota archaeon]|nr:AmmeMemoRadiSam system protein B [Candidatus Lokiarchaeota archaeon]